MEIKLDPRFRDFTKEELLEVFGESQRCSGRKLRKKFTPKVAFREDGTVVYVCAVRGNFNSNYYAGEHNVRAVEEFGLEESKIRRITQVGEEDRLLIC